MSEFTVSSWQEPPPSPHLAEGETHVWRVPLDRPDVVTALLPELSTDERLRVERFHFPVHGLRYAVAHGLLRRILARYTGRKPSELEFIVGAHGKPDLAPNTGTDRHVHFNLSHSADVALVAVSTTGAVGVDVEFWREDVQHLEISERFFSAAEQHALQSLAFDPEGVRRGFFSGWSRKEAYLKATGFGIARGLAHFDVSLEPGRHARLLADRLDEAAVERWTMTELHVGAGYSAAVVVTAPLRVIQLYDARFL